MKTIGEIIAEILVEGFLVRGSEIKPRNDTSYNWAQINPILMDRELIVETDTLKIKLGDGKTYYNNLPYIW